MSAKTDGSTSSGHECQKMTYLSVKQQEFFKTEQCSKELLLFYLFNDLMERMQK